ncbi:MAG: polysulfide reductase NrfD [Acidobacteriota bacterium]|jgi:molybdopterin-containing oxidoreductase family membrane subunit|nr:polysulfide reductase NrfD [Acidobacteriota bacterium]
MLEMALRGNARYWTWILFLIILTGGALAMFVLQYTQGLTVTAMSRDMPWGFYIAQLTFLVGVAASAVVVVLPHYLHDVREFGRLTIFGEFLAIPAVVVAILFVFVDIGQPQRVLNLFLYPSPRSPMFWDSVALAGYLVLNLVIGWKTLEAQRREVPPPAWLKPMIYLAIPWAISIHTVTAFLYCGLAARPFWLTAVLTPRFLASAFAAGPALLILLCLVMRRISSFDPGDLALTKLSKIMAYAMAANLFLLALELFTAFYSGSPEHISPWVFLYSSVGGVVAPVVPFMWLSLVLGILSMILLLRPATYANPARLAPVAAMIFVSIWIDKGAGMMTGGLNPSPLGRYSPYFPSWVEIVMGVGLYAFGALILTGLYKIAVSVKQGAVAD